VIREVGWFDRFGTLLVSNPNGKHPLPIAMSRSETILGIPEHRVGVPLTAQVGIRSEGMNVLPDVR